MKYKVDFTEIARDDLVWLQLNEPKAFLKAKNLIFELSEHPFSGTGKPKLLKYGWKGCYSRRITQKNRLIYSVDNEKVTVLVLSATQHYDDK
jgi:toxin YoeB